MAVEDGRDGVGVGDGGGDGLEKKRIEKEQSNERKDGSRFLCFAFERLFWLLNLTNLTSSIKLKIMQVIIK